MTELGVYILGAVALVLLGAAGIATGDRVVIICAVGASGAAYLGQLAALSASVNATSARWSIILNAGFLLVALAAWAFGAFNLL